MYPIPANATRIRYLESTGTQYIDTGYAFTDDYSFEIDFDGISTDMSLFGARSGNVRTSVVYYSGTTGFSVNIAGYTGTTTPFYLSPIVPNTRMTFKTTVVSNKCSIWIDGESKYMNEAFSGSYISGVTMTLFATKYGNNDFREKTSSKVYSVKMWQGSTLVRSFVPVRVGTVGYLFDRVSGQLFGNAGTGDFVLGPDTFATGVLPTRMCVMGVRKREPNTWDYVQYGLVGMWDGIENAGRGVHDSQARMIDLAGNHVPLAFSNASTDSDAIVLTASSYATLNANEWADIRTIFNSGNFTIQFCGEPSTGSNNWWTIMNSTPDSNYGRITVRPTFSTSSNLYKKFEAAVFGDSGATWGGTGPGMGLNASYNIPDLFDGNPGSFRCASVICNSNGAASVVVNDTRFDFTTGSWPISTTRTGDMYFGHENSSKGYAAGKWHSIRIYNRALTTSEVAANYAIDKVRFNLP